MQGSGPRSPLEGQTVAVEGVVVGPFARNLGGVFIQSLAEDGDPATSEGLYLTRSGDAEPRLKAGDRVRATGPVVELGRGEATLTALDGVGVEVIGEAPVQALDLADAPADAAGWEALEGRRLRITVPLTVTGNDSLGRYGELSVSFDGRRWTPTERAAPGPAAQALAAENARVMLRLDDARDRQDPDRIWYLPAAGLPMRYVNTRGSSARLLDEVERLGLFVTTLDGPTQMLRLHGQLDGTTVGDAEPDSFDRILVDAPCSATGVIRRHPDIKILRRARDIPALARRQAELLEAAADCAIVVADRIIRPLGTLVGATRAAAGGDLSGYNRKVYMFPRNGCSWSGLALVNENPSMAWINGSFNLKAVGHELGHNLGLRHAHALDCDVSATGNTCTRLPYGDAADLMGNVRTGDFSPYAKERMGWLNDGVSPPILTADPSPCVRSRAGLPSCAM